MSVDELIAELKTLDRGKQVVFSSGRPEIYEVISIYDSEINGKGVVCIDIG